MLRCVACGRTVLRRAQWGHLAYSRCGGPAPARAGLPLPVWEREYHHVALAGLGFAQCARCGLRTAASRITQWRRRVCIARRLHVAGLPTAVDWGAALAAQLGWAPGPPRAGVSVWDRLLAPALAPAAVPAAVAVPLSMRFGYAARLRVAAAPRSVNAAAAISRLMRPPRVAPAGPASLPAGSDLPPGRPAPSSGLASTPLQPRWPAGVQLSQLFRWPAGLQPLHGSPAGSAAWASAGQAAAAAVSSTDSS